MKLPSVHTPAVGWPLDSPQGPREAANQVGSLPPKLTWATMLDTSPVLDGRMRVLDSLASLEKALTYCSATDRDAAEGPFWEQKRGGGETEGL